MDAELTATNETISEFFSSEENKTLAIISKVTGCLSAIGDTYIIYDILSDRKKWRTSYHRIMLGMSIVDFMVSAMYIVSSWAIPEDTNPEYNVFRPYGNMFTCDLQGFIIQFGIAAPMYNTLLCFYYYAVIVKGWKESQVRKLEITMHILALTLGIVTAIIALEMEQYNNSMTICWIRGEPFGCEFLQEVECSRGEHADFYHLYMYTLPLWSALIAAVVALAGVFYHVQAQEKKVGKWRKGSTNREKSKLTREVAWQSFWYLLAFFVTWIPATVNGIMVLAGSSYTYRRLMLMYSTMPLQGILNLFIYVRPRYIRWVKRHQQFSVRLKIMNVYNFCAAKFGQIRRMSLENVDCESNESGQSQSYPLDAEDPNVTLLSLNSKHNVFSVGSEDRKNVQSDLGSLAPELAAKELAPAAIGSETASKLVESKKQMMLSMEEETRTTEKVMMMKREKARIVASFINDLHGNTKEHAPAVTGNKMTAILTKKLSVG